MLVKQQSNVINQSLNFMCVGFQASIAMGGVFIIVLLTYEMHCNNYDIELQFLQSFSIRDAAISKFHLGIVEDFGWTLG